MMSMMGEEAVGVMFDPTDWEIISYYLPQMADGDENVCRGFIHSLDIYECEPWNLLPPDEFKHGSSGNQAFFFTPRHPAAFSSKSSRPHARRTVRGGVGFWHGKAHENHIRQLGKSGPIVGRKTSLNFKTRNGLPTDWIMQEYLLGRGDDNIFQSVALCKIYKKLNGRRSCKKQVRQQPEYKIAEADDGLPPPCKKQRIDLQVEGFSTFRLPSSSEDLITTPRGGGQRNTAAFASCKASAVPPIAVREEEDEEVVVHSNDFDMFTFAQLLGEDEDEEEEVGVLPAQATAADQSRNDEMLVSLAARLLGEEEEMALPTEANELFASFTQLLEGNKEEVGDLPAEATTADCSHNDERFASLASRLLGKEEEEEEMTLPVAANELFTSFTQLLEGNKEEVGDLPAEATVEDRLYNDESFAGLAARLLGKEEEEIALPATANELFTSFTELLEGNKEVPAVLDNGEETFHTLVRFFRDEDMLTQYDDFCIDDYLCLENYPS